MLFCNILDLIIHPLKFKYLNMINKLHKLVKSAESRLILDYNCQKSHESQAMISLWIGFKEFSRPVVIVFWF